MQILLVNDLDCKSKPANSSFRDALFNNITEFKELFFVSGTGSISYSGNQLNLPNIISALNNFDGSLLQTKTRNYFSGGENAMVNWYKNNQFYPFVYYATLADIAAVTTYQTNNTGLYKPSGAPASSNGISFYFNEIKTYFGQSLVDQLLDTYLSSSNLYIDKLVVNEWHIYGSSRLGIYKTDVLVASKTVHITNGTGNTGTAAESEYNSTELSPLITPVLDLNYYSQTRGAKNYELSNHLGNVLVVITDKKTWCTNKEVYSTDFKTGTNGFDGGWSKYTQGGTNWSGIDQYNGSIVTNDNGRLKTTATVGYGGNRNVVNTDANKSYTFTFDLDIGNTTGLYVNARATNGTSPYTGTNLAQIYVTASGTYTLTFTASTATTQLLFEKDNYGTTYFYIDNAKVAETNATTSSYYLADVVTANDYSPFGAPLAGRSYTAPNSDYRFGFNGKELDKGDEGMGGGGSTYDYGFRIYNAQLGRFLSVDPLSRSYPWYTPYQFAGNTPINAIDLDVLEEYFTHEYTLKNSFGIEFLYRVDYKTVLETSKVDFTKNTVAVMFKGNWKRISSNVDAIKDAMRNYDRISALQAQNNTNKAKLSDYSGQRINALKQNGTSGTAFFLPELTYPFKPDRGITAGEIKQQYENPANRAALIALDNLATAMVADPTLKAKVTGYASTTPTNLNGTANTTDVKNNATLAQQRAEAGKTALLDYIKNNLGVQNFDANRITTETKKLDTNEQTPEVNQKTVITPVYAPR